MVEEQTESHAEKKQHSFWYGVTNPRWISIKVHYFVLCAGLSSAIAFIIPFYKSLGLSTTQIGVIEFLVVLIGIFARPMIGTIADKSERSNLVVGFCTLCFLVPTTCFIFVPTPSSQEPFNATLRLNSTNFDNLEICNFQSSELLSSLTSIVVDSQSNSAMTRLVCDDLSLPNGTFLFNTLAVPNSNNCSMLQLATPQSDFVWALRNESEQEYINCEIHIPVESSNTAFIWICLLRSLSALTLGGTVTLVDAIAYDILGPEHRNLWGQQRMFASLGWGLGGGIMGIVLDHFSSYRICFLTFGVITTISMLLALFWLPKRSKQTTKNEKQMPFCQALRISIVTPIFCTICLVAISSGMLLAIFQAVWPQHMVALGAPKRFFGMVSVTIGLLQIPSLFFAGMLTDKIGESGCFFIMYLAYTIRLTANAFLTPDTVWLALIFESLHMFCFGLFLSAITRTAAIIALHGTSSTVQSLLATAYLGIGNSSGVLLSSLIFDAFGHNIAFLIYAGFALFCFLILFVVYFSYLKAHMARKSKTTESDSAATEKIKENEAPSADDRLIDTEM